MTVSHLKMSTISIHFGIASKPIIPITCDEIDLLPVCLFETKH